MAVLVVRAQAVLAQTTQAQAMREAMLPQLAVLALVAGKSAVSAL
jgi:hypothetical protein